MKFDPGLKFEDAIVQERIGVFLESDIHLLSGEDERLNLSHADWKFRCNVCKCVIIGLHGAQNHMDGNRHEQNFNFAKTGEGEFVESKYKKNATATSTGKIKEDFQVDSMEIWDVETNEEINPLEKENTANNQSVPIPNKTQVPKAAYPYLTMQEKLTSLVEPIVGLENVVEHHIATGEMPPYYECQLCKSDMADANLINHLKGRSHRMNYIQSKNMEKYSSITNLPSYNVGRAMLNTIVELETEFGRGFMPIVIDSDVTKHPDSKNYQTLREKMKENEKSVQKRPFTVENANTLNNKERKKKRGILGKPENKMNTIAKGPVTNTVAFGSGMANMPNNYWPGNNFNNYPNMQGYNQMNPDQMGTYYQNQFYQPYYGQMNPMGQPVMTSNFNQARPTPPINPELVSSSTVAKPNEPILGQAPSTSNDNQPILGQAPDSAPLLGPAPVTTNQPILGAAPLPTNAGQGLLNPTETTMNQSMMGHGNMMNPGMMGQGQMMNPGMMGQGQMMNPGMMGQGQMMNPGMMGQGQMMNPGMMGQGQMMNPGMMGQGQMMNTGMMGQGQMMNTGMMGQGQMNSSMMGQGQLMNPNMMAQGTMMNQNMMGQGTMMNQNMMAQGTMANQNMMGQGTMTNQNMMGQGTMTNQNMMGQGTMVNQNMKGQGTMTNQNMMGQGTMTNPNMIGQDPLMNQRYGANTNAYSMTPQASSALMNQGLITNQPLSQGLPTNQLSTTVSQDGTTSNNINPIISSQNTSAILPTPLIGVIGQTTTCAPTKPGGNPSSSVQALLETPKDSLLGPPPSTRPSIIPILGKTNGESLLATPSIPNGPTRYNFISSKNQSIPLLGSDGQLTEKKGFQQILDDLATCEIKTDDDASVAGKIITNLTLLLDKYKETSGKLTTSSPIVVNEVDKENNGESRQKDLKEVIGDKVVPVPSLSTLDKNIEIIDLHKTI